MSKNYGCTRNSIKGFTMKVNRSSSIAKKNMRKKGDTSNRPEQMLVAEILKYFVTQNIETEVKLKDVYEVGGVDLSGRRAPKVDILMTWYIQKYAIRVNGKYHDGREQYDKIQRYFLESQEPAYRVVDVNYFRHELLFERHNRKLTKSELFIVLDLLQAEFLSYGIKFNLGKINEWLNKTDHIDDRSNV